MYPHYRSAKYPPPGLGLSKQADFDPWKPAKAVGTWFKEGFQNLGGTFKKNFGEHSEKYTQGHEMLNALPGSKAAYLDPFSELSEKHGGDYNKMMADPEFGKAITELNRGLTQEDLEKLDTHYRNTIIPHLQNEYRKYRASGGKGSWEEFKAQQTNKFYSGFANARKLHAAGGWYGAVGHDTFQSMNAVQGYQNDPGLMFASGGRQHLQNMANLYGNAQAMNAIKTADPNTYNQLMANKGKLEWANQNYGHLQSLNEFKNDPISFLFNNFFGDPTKLYSVLDSLGKIYNPKKYDQSESWNKYLANGNQAVQGYSSWWPWLAMLGNIRSSLSGDDRNWVA